MYVSVGLFFWKLFHNVLGMFLCGYQKLAFRFPLLTFGKRNL